MGTILQVFQADSGQWGGRLLRDGVEGHCRENKPIPKPNNHLYARW